MLRIGIVAGETSGDIIAADFINTFKDSYPEVQFEGIAGPLMRDAGCKAIFQTEDMSVMGFTEVLKKLPQLLKIRKQIAAHFIKNPPDVFIGVDAPDFNLTLERKLKGHGISTVHYVSPSAWAWRSYRVKKIARSFDMMLSLLPFEASFYQKHGVDAKFIGHPMADQIPFENKQSAAIEKLQLADNLKTVALLPGSRSSEVKNIFPLLLEAANYTQRALGSVKKDPNIQFVVPAATPKLKILIDELVLQESNDLSITVVESNARDAMLASDVVMLASGTATLEAMLLKRPMIVTYRMSKLSFQIFKFFTVVEYIALPNFFDDSHPVPEFIQDNATQENLGEALLELLNNPQKREAMIQNFQKYHESLKHNASQQATNAVMNLIEEKNAATV